MSKGIVINVLPHLQFKGDWLVECRELLPNALWYKSCENAIYYAKLLGKDNAGEIRVFSRDRSTDQVIELFPTENGNNLHNPASVQTRVPFREQACHQDV